MGTVSARREICNRWPTRNGAPVRSLRRERLSGKRGPAGGPGKTGTGNKAAVRWLTPWWHDVTWLTLAFFVSLAGLLAAPDSEARLPLFLLLAAQGGLYSAYPIFMHPQRHLSISYVFTLLAAAWLPGPAALVVSLVGGVAGARVRKLAPRQAASTLLVAVTTAAGAVLGFQVHQVLGTPAPAWFAGLAFPFGMAGFSALELVGVLVRDKVAGNDDARRAWQANLVDSVTRYLLLTTVAMLVDRAVGPLRALSPSGWAAWVGLAVFYLPVYYAGVLRQHTFDVICAWGRAVDAKDPYTQAHSERVAQYALAVGREMGLPERELWVLLVAARLHDIGKIFVRDDILSKPGRLTDEEFAHLRRHAEWGARILSGIRQFAAVAKIVRSHHERWDGGGYPDGLAGAAIPRLSRILAVVDAFDAMTSDRSYRAAFSPDEARRRIREGAGAQFDPEAVQAFCRAYAKGLETAPSPFAHCALH